MAKDEKDPGTLDMLSGKFGVLSSSPERKARLNRERQKRFRERQAELGRTKVLNNLTEDERFYLERVLYTMRETNGVPAMVRNEKGQMVPVDI